jgi:hypothetical protein
MLSLTMVYRKYLDAKSQALGLNPKAALMAQKKLHNRRGTKMKCVLAKEDRENYTDTESDRIKLISRRVEMGRTNLKGVEE